ncbi:MAG: GatB/YqeY domain-containing protein [Pseudomonadales bacterium]|nr:GatB/YqeY domain-containing protein [Pseudomonadales bacterium]MDG1444307.1 GatB/YqeY domain-containing protein [Pseudomonadales bacterium]
MSTSELKPRIESSVKDAMRAREKQRLGVLRLVMSELKRVEVDERIELDDERIISILVKMSKQRKDSLTQYLDAGRQDLADQEQYELDLLQEFLPVALDEAAIAALIDAAIAQTGASSMKDMGKVMGVLKPQVQGRADVGALSATIKAKLQ